ncbi:MAG: hypothetical protein HY984_00960 [Candidatus Magasanikbacteria bacterium]|nr:hypothetical protein [Candidatus Magasanikbacteria bacterium]
MGLFSGFFGSSSSRYSTTPHTFTQYELRELFEHIHIGSLTMEEKHLVEGAIEAEARRWGGKLSLRKINDILRQLKYAKGQHISENDRLALMKVFEQYVASHGRHS